MINMSLKIRLKVCLIMIMEVNNQKPVNENEIQLT